MSARAIWKAVLCLGRQRVPVKLYAAARDRRIRFRLLHEEDREPVRQVLVNPETERLVPHEEARRAWESPQRELVLLDAAELKALEPEPSRRIDLEAFLPAGEIDHRWYARPYYLGPDEGGHEAWAALAAALEAHAVEGLARWVMRRREYVGALRLHEGVPMLVALRHDEEVVPVEELPVPPGPRLEAQELAMAEQLVEMLAADFEGELWRDEYRERVVALVERKAKGGRVTRRPATPARAATDDLLGALEASLAETGGQGSGPRKRTSRARKGSRGRKRKERN